MRKILPFLIAILLLSACASVPPAPSPPVSPQVKDLPDNSNPNLASLYYFMVGSYLRYEGAYKMADQVFALALEQDPASFQIRKAFFNNAALRYLVHQDQEAEQRLKDILAIAKKSYTFDEEMLQVAYTCYEVLDDIQGMQWAVERLLRDYPTPRVYIMQYLCQAKASAKPDSALLEKALQQPHVNDEIKLLAAAQYSETNPDRAIEILLETERNSRAETLLLSLYVEQEDISALRTHFDSYHYPEDKAKISAYLSCLLQNALYDLAAEHSAEIIASEDMDLIKELALIAYYAHDSKTQQDIASYLQNKIPTPESDGEIAAILLFHSLLNPDFDMADWAADKIYQSSDLDNILYYTVLQKQYRDDISNDFVNAFGDLHQKILTTLPPSVVKDYLVEQSGYMAQKAQSDSTGALNLARHLIQKGYGSHKEFLLLIQYYLSAGKEEEKIAIMREYYSRYPNNATIKNDLGYTLLSYPEHWEEAEQLIRAAVKAEPNNVNFLDSLAWLHYLKAEYQEAKSYLPSLIQSDETNAELLYHAAMISLANGERSAAIKYLEQGLESQDPSGFHDKIKLQLKLLKSESR